MNPDSPCAKCGSTRVVPKARMIDGRDYSFAPTTNLQVGVAAKPDAAFFTEERRSDISARVCGTCGYMELYAEDHDRLYRAHVEASRRK